MGLTACGGGSSTSIPDNSIFSSFFVSDWSAYETAATNLLAQARYAVQNATLNIDTDGDSVFDSQASTNSIRHAGIQYAHAAGLTGAGQKIAVSDAGFLTSHEAIADDLAIVQAGLPVDSHGTFVASVISGDTSSMIGVAPDADLILGHWDTTDLIDTGAQALSQRAVAWNNSWGYVNSALTTSFYNSIFGAGDGATYLQTLKDYAAYGNVVFSISNSVNAADAGLMPGLPALVPELESGWIAVVNGAPTMVSGNIVSAVRVSGACLEAARWCITADGTWYGATSGGNSSYAYGTGTSYAAPTVSGALALLAEAFPALTPHQLRLRLFATADNTFAEFSTDEVVTLANGYQSAVSYTWGHGFLDVKSALLPIGQMTVNAGGGQTINANQPLVMAGSATGGAIAASLEKVDLFATDLFAGAFSLNAASLVQNSAPEGLFTDQTAALNGRAEAPRALSADLFDRDPTVQSFIGDLHVATYLPVHSGQFETAGVSFGKRHHTSFGHVDWQAGVGSDNGALLPLWQNENGQDLASFGVSLNSKWGAGQLDVSTVMATAPATGSTSQVMLNSSEVSYSVSSVFDRNDRLKMSLRQPFAITSGSTDLTLAVFSGGTTQMQTIAVDLAPSKREFQIAMDYEIEIERDTDLMLSLVHALNRGHVAGAEETGMFFGFRKTF